MISRFKERARWILATHTPPPLPAGAERKIAAILNAAEARETTREEEEQEAHQA
jgi:hypothetical protein